MGKELMALQPRHGDDITIHFTVGEEQHRKHATYLGEDDDYVFGKGVVGGEIGHKFAFPKFRIIYIEWTPSRFDLEDIA